MASRILTACAGFLFAVLWMDLMFDVQVLGAPADAPLPPPVLASIAAYYHRVTTTAWPMGPLIGIVMMIGVSALVNTIRGDGPLWRDHLILLIAAPVARPRTGLPERGPAQCGIALLAQRADCAGVRHDHVPFVHCENNGPSLAYHQIGDRQR
jgi:hypothetical protein